MGIGRSFQQHLGKVAPFSTFMDEWNREGTQATNPQIPRFTTASSENALIGSGNPMHLRDRYAQIAL
jgi:hypothetical protein